jgi:phenylacetate-CoA ligase
MEDVPGTRSRTVAGRWREQLARVLWHAHPARPGAEYASLRESQWWSREQLEELQALRLRRLVAAAARVPFYRDRFRAAGVGPEDIRTIDDIRRLPILERHDLERLGVKGMRTPGSFGMRARSSGSLGRPVEILWPLEQMRWLDAVEARARAWLGSEVGERRLEVRCRPVGLPQAINAVLLNAEALHAPAVADPDVARRLVRSIQRRPPTLVWGVSNALYVVALALLEQGRTVSTRACWSGGNHLHPHYRRTMQEAFQCSVYNRYATIETGLIAHECPEGNSLHVPAEGIVAEIVRPDGSPAAPGEMGEVLVTALRNPATPLVRYRVGDRAIAAADPQCSCGRGLPVFGAVAGRTRDFLRTASGELVSPHQAVEAVGPAMDRVVDFQVIQDEDRRLRILVVQRDSPLSEADRERIATILEQLVQPPERPLVNPVDQIALTPGGKLRTIVSDAAP